MATMELGIQSYCFRGFKALDALLAQIRGVGLNRTELCAVHVDFNDEGAFEGVVEGCKKAGVIISSIGVQKFRGDWANEEKWFRFCRLCGAKLVSASFDVASTPEVYRGVEKMAEKYDVRLGIHNHGGYDWLGNSTMVGQLFNTTGERIGLCLDTAWCIQAGEDPHKWVERFGSRIYGVHVKDFVFDRAGKWSDVVVGAGNLKLAELLRAVGQCPAILALTLEYEGDVENPGPKLRECVAAIKAAGGNQ